MTTVLFTTDTELSPAFHARGMSPRENLDIAVMGCVAGEEWGIAYQLARLSEHGLRGVFFVEALCAEALGLDVVKRVVDPILSAGHEVQLHLHTEWLAWAANDPVAGRRGENIADFSESDQKILLELGLEALVAAGAPRPTAFRAGNYGADNATLRALAALGIAYDTSYNYPYLGQACRIDAPHALLSPATLEGLTEIPITFFEDLPGHARPLQLCAVSARELAWCIENSRTAGRPTVVIVSHSFELLNAKRNRANKILLRRFDALCATLQSVRGSVSGFAGLQTLLASPAAPSGGVLKSSPARTAARMAEQAVGALLYDRH